METKQTAVDWMIDQLRVLAHNPKTHLGMGDVRLTQGYIDELVQQAKQMEKEQMKGLYIEGAKWVIEQIKRQNEKNPLVEKSKQYVKCTCANLTQAENCIKICGHHEEPEFKQQDISQRALHKIAEQYAEQYYNETYRK